MSLKQVRIIFRNLKIGYIFLFLMILLSLWSALTQQIITQKVLLIFLTKQRSNLYTTFFFQTAYPVFSNQKHISFCQVTYPTTFSYYNFPQIIHHCSYCMGKPTSNKAFIYQWPFQVYFKIITGCRIFCTLHPFLRICL